MISEQFCHKCGSEIQDKNNFCTKCGTAVITNQESTKEKSGFVSKSHKRSPFWYLLPIFLGFVGGIIVYFILKNTDNQKAKRALVIGIIFSIPMFAWISFQIVYGTQNPFYVVASGGMSPSLEVYDIVITQGHEQFEDVQVGDIIVFNRLPNHDRVIVQRVASILNDNPLTLQTKGDAYSEPTSSDFPITEKDYIGKVTYVIPQVGYITQILKPPMNYIIIAVFLGIIFGILGNKHQKYKKSQNF